jgi:hypothetical protein
MSYAGSSDRRAAHDTRVKKEENLAILRQEGLGAPLADVIPPRQQPSFCKPRVVK